jgi:hypothetical protein
MAGSTQLAVSPGFIPSLSVPAIRHVYRPTGLEATQYVPYGRTSLEPAFPLHSLPSLDATGPEPPIAVGTIRVLWQICVQVPAMIGFMVPASQRDGDLRTAHEPHNGDSVYVSHGTKGEPMRVPWQAGGV